MEISAEEVLEEESGVSVIFQEPKVKVEPPVETSSASEKLEDYIEKRKLGVDYRYTWLWKEIQTNTRYWRLCVSKR